MDFALENQREDERAEKYRLHLYCRRQPERQNARNEGFATEQIDR